MGLFSPGWANKNPEKVIRWIERGKADNEALIQTVLYRNEPEIRKAALARIDDVHTLKCIILKTDDDGLLEEMIRSKARCAYWKKEFSDEAAAKIGSRQVLEELAKDHYACALSRITDEETLCRIAADRNFFRKTDRKSVV